MVIAFYSSPPVYHKLLYCANRYVDLLGIHLLRGRTEYGDSIEDEWVVVYLLREVSRKFDNIWVKVTDSDGEFLLVEAAAALPAWLEPEIADNRVSQTASTSK